MPGRVVKRSRSSWTVIVDIGRDPVTGRRRQLSRAVQGPKREAEALLVQLLHERDTGVERPLGRLTVAEYLARWQRDYVEPSLAPKTAVTYRDVIRVHLVPAFGAMELSALRPTHIQALYTRLLERLSPRSVQRYTSRTREREHHPGHLQPRPARPPGCRRRGARRASRRAESRCHVSKM